MLPMPWQRWFWPLEMNARSLWKERVLKEAEFCKRIFKHTLPAEQSGASASPVEVSRIVSMSDMPETARNTEKSKSEPVFLPAWPLLVRGSAARQPHRLVSQLPYVWQAVAATVDQQFPFLGLLPVSAQPAGSGNPKVLLVPRYELEGKQISSLCPRAMLPNLANAAGQDSPRGHCPYSPWLSTGNSLAPSALKQLANSGFY